MALFLITAASVVLYALSGAFGAYAALNKEAQSAPRAKVLFGTALACQSAAIGITSISTSGTIVSGPNILMLAAWVLAVASFALAVLRSRSHAYLAFAGPVTAILITFAHILSITSNASSTNHVYYEWPMLVAHILLVFLAAASFAVSAASSVMQLHQSSLMKRKSRQLLLTNMPAISTLAKLARLAALIGTILFTFSILIGATHFTALYAAMSAAGCQGEILYLAPRMALSVLVWLLYAVYLVLEYLFPTFATTKVRSRLSICGFILVAVLIAVSAGLA